MTGAAMLRRAAGLECLVETTSKRRPMRPCAILLLMAFALPVKAEVLCPDSIDVQQQANIGGDWIVSYTDPPLRLTGVTIYDGPPSQNHKVKPYSVKSAKGEL